MTKGPKDLVAKHMAAGTDVTLTNIATNLLLECPSIDDGVPGWQEAFTELQRRVDEEYVDAVVWTGIYHVATGVDGEVVVTDPIREQYLHCLALAGVLE